MALTAKPKRKPPLHAKKRTGQHHRQSKHYVKAYLPYLPALVILAAGLWINTIWAKPAHVLGARSDMSAASLLASTNDVRQAGHENDLALNAALTTAAQAKANDMATRNYWSHTTPDGKSPWSFITGAGYAYQTAGENLAYGFSSAHDTVSGWMNSPEHRANMLDPAYVDVGFGVASSANYQGKGPEVIVVALYAKPVPAAANITFNVPATASNTTAKPLAGNTLDPSAKLVSRIQLLTNGHASWSLAAVSFLSGIAATVYVIRHGLRLRKLMRQGEHFVSMHIGLDIIIVLTAVAGFILTRTSGVIR
jgi:uncharacterized protein YkwD